MEWLRVVPILLGLCFALSWGSGCRQEVPKGIWRTPLGVARAMELSPVKPERVVFREREDEKMPAIKEDLIRKGRVLIEKIMHEYEGSGARYYGIYEPDFLDRWGFLIMSVEQGFSYGSYRYRIDGKRMDLTEILENWGIDGFKKIAVNDFPRSQSTKGHRFWAIMAHHGFNSISQFGRVVTEYHGNFSPMQIPYSEKFRGLEGLFYQDLQKELSGETGKNFYNALQDVERSNGNLPSMKVWALYYSILRNCAMFTMQYQGSFKSYIENSINTNIKEITASHMQKYLNMNPWNKIYGVSQNVFEYILGWVNFSDERVYDCLYKHDSTNQEFFFKTGLYRLAADREINSKEQIYREMAIKVLHQIKGNYKIRAVNSGIFWWMAVKRGGLPVL